MTNHLSNLTTNRRSFLVGMGALAAAPALAHDIAPKSVFTGKVEGRRLKIAAIGCGGMGGAATDALISAGCDLVAVCDIAPAAFASWEKRYPGIPKYTDYRKMLKEIGDRFEAVQVGTPDHTHAYISIDCMNAGKHVYVQKPLARTLEECELMLKAQERNNVVVQMGNQGHPGVWRYQGLRDLNAWGEIKAIYSWSDRPIWPQGMTEYPKAQPLPKGYAPEAWDCWCGPAEDHGYSNAFHAFKWRGWWAYGCGAIGDMAVHNADPAFWAFELGLPVKVKADTFGEGPASIAYPKKSRIEMTFAPNKWIPKGIDLVWTDGGVLPSEKEVPGLAEFVKTQKNGKLPGNGLIIIGTKATTIGGSHAAPPACIAGDKAAFAAAYEKAEKAYPFYSHYREFIDACLAEKPMACGSRLQYAAPLTEALLIGCISLRFPGQTLAFDPSGLAFTNNDAANVFLKAPKRGDWNFANLDRPWWRFW